jgi:hypothetical protein
MNICSDDPSSDEHIRLLISQLQNKCTLQAEADRSSLQTESLCTAYELLQDRHKRDMQLPGLARSVSLE